MKKLPKKIVKRDNSIADFNPAKIEAALFKAALSVVKGSKKAREIAGCASEKVLKKIASRFADKTPSIEDIQDIAEETLIEKDFSTIAKNYILYRKQHQDIRQAKTLFGIKDDLKLPINSILVLEKRYLLKDDSGRVIETPKEMFERVAKKVSEAEINYSSPSSADEMQETFFNIMSELDFLPNSPTLMNAGTPLNQLSACFVLPVEDSMEDIFESVKNMALIHRTGGGTGFSFSKLRPRGDLVSTTKGKASGPVSFMSIFNQTTDVIIQGGRRRGANMGILRCDHPDILEFVEAKLKNEEFCNFNLSVAVTDRFIECVRKNNRFDLVNPKTGRKVQTIKAKALFDLITFCAWRTGDPGLIFLDQVNRYNPTPDIGTIEATNPCSEVLLLPFESCNLGSINLSNMVSSGSINWEKLKKSVRIGVRFLDNVIDVNSYPLPVIQQTTAANRKIGLGVMGFADMLIKIGISYCEPKAAEIARTVMKFIKKESFAASAELAKKRGSFPNIKYSVYSKKHLRNATLNAIAPTGSISIIAGCSSGIEPLFSLSFTRTILDGTKLFETHSLLEEELKKSSVYSEELAAQVRKKPSIQHIKSIPEHIKKIFVTTFDVAPMQHLKIQSAFQKFTDNAVSKTVNLPPDATVDDVRKIYLLGHSLKCKGITVYRYGSRQGQVLTIEPSSETDTRTNPFKESSCSSENCFL